RGTVNSVKVWGDTLYAAANVLGVRLFDTTAGPAAPIGGFSTPGSVGNFDDSAALLMVTPHSQLVVGDGRIGLSIYDLVAAPRAPPPLPRAPAPQHSPRPAPPAPALGGGDDTGAFFSSAVPDMPAPQPPASARSPGPSGPCLALFPAGAANRLYVGGGAHMGV